MVVLLVLVAVLLVAVVRLMSDVGRRVHGRIREQHRWTLNGHRSARLLDDNTPQ